MSHENTEKRITVSALEKHNYSAVKIIGHGGAGRAILATDQNEDECVIKEINFTNESTRKEVEIMKKMKHPFIVSFIDSFEEDEKQYIVMEYCKDGDLSQRIIQKKNENQFFKEDQVLDWFVQILLALDYVHNDMKFLHGDIKPQNVFLTEEQYINLGDFGGTRALESEVASKASIIGTNLYYSPEIFDKNLTCKSDVWSLGWLLYDLCMPQDFGTKNRCLLFLQSISADITPTIPEIYSHDLRGLVRELLVGNPDSRPSISEILAKPYLQETVNRQKQLSEGVQTKFINIVREFGTIYEQHCPALEVHASEWNIATDEFDTMYRRATAASLTGGVIGAAGGITALVGAILAPFTLGASLIVTGVGVGVGVAGGVTSGTANITKMAKQKSIQETLKEIEQNFTTESQPIINILKKIRKLIQKIDKFGYFADVSTFDLTQIGCRMGRNVASAAEIIHICMLANVGRIASQASRAAVAISGVISGVFVILDMIFIYKDSKEIHEMINMTEESSLEEIKSNVVKSIAEMRKAHKAFTDFICVINTAKSDLDKLMNKVEETKLKNN